MRVGPFAFRYQGNACNASIAARCNKVHEIGTIDRRVGLIAMVFGDFFYSNPFQLQPSDVVKTFKTGPVFLPPEIQTYVL